MHTRQPSGDRGIVVVFLLFGMCAFAVLSIAALSTAMGGAPIGKTFGIFRAIPQDALTKFVATFVVPNDWKGNGDKGSFQFQLPVVVPEIDGDDTGASAAYTVTEVPGMAVCCEGRDGICLHRNEPSGGMPIADWTPSQDDAMWLLFDLASQPDPNSKAPGEIVTATVTQSAPSEGVAVEGTAIACQLEFNGGVIAKGTAVLREIPREPGSALNTPAVAGTMTLAVKKN